MNKRMVLARGLWIGKGRQMYKEGQGKWARGSLAVILAGVGLYATVSVSGWLEGNDWGSGVLFTIPVVSWALKTQDVLSVLVFMPFLLAG